MATVTPSGFAKYCHADLSYHHPLAIMISLSHTALQIILCVLELYGLELTPTKLMIHDR